MSKASLKRALVLGSHWVAQVNGAAVRTPGTTAATNYPRTVAHVQTNAIAFSVGPRTHEHFERVRTNPNRSGRWCYLDGPHTCVTQESPRVWAIWRWRDDGTAVEPEHFEVRTIKGRECERLMTLTLVEEAPA